MVSRARLGTRRRCRDDVRLDSRVPKTGWQWCHGLVSASVVAAATSSASTCVMLRQGEMVSRARLDIRRRYRDDIRLDLRCAKTGENGVTCSSRRPSSLP